VKAGDRVRTREGAAHVFDSFVGEVAVVTRVRQLGGREWCDLEFPQLGRTTALPAGRLELVEPGAGDVSGLGVLPKEMTIRGYVAAKRRQFSPSPKHRTR